MTFSEREGHKKPKSNSLESMDASLKNAIWNVIYKHIDSRYVSYGSTGYEEPTFPDTRAQVLWTDFFGQKISGMRASFYFSDIEKLYDKLAWHEVYDLIEFFLAQNPSFNRGEFNKVLTKHNCPYRVINSVVQPISDKETISSIELAHNNSLSEEVRDHLKKAQALYSNKQNPDFTNSCLESIKAVEGTCRLILSNDKILGKNINNLRPLPKHNQHIVSTLEKLNAFRGDVTSHAKKQESYTPDRQDAILIHTICCGFVNYFKSK